MAELPDVLVIGSGAAGLSFALEASRNLLVQVVTKDELRESNTRYAQGGIAAVLRLEDEYQQHIADTLSAGAGICDVEAVKVLVQEAPARIRDLIDWGVNFDRAGDQTLLFTREGGHRTNRILHVGDLTGQAIEEAMIHRVRTSPNIVLEEHRTLVDLILVDGRCFGALLLDQDGWIRPVFARSTFLATGGAGQLFSRTTNPTIATGDGMAVAARAGAALDGMEFVQFHPTAFSRADAPSFLLSEALRGEGARLRDSRGEQFMSAYHEMAELAPRDVVSRAIYEVMRKQEVSSVFLDIRHRDPEFLQNRFPFVYESCRNQGLDLAKDLVPVSPAAHYMCGGVKTDLDGQTSIDGLYASGEVASTGVHGANRLASNSLLESVVFAYRAAVSVDRTLRFLGQAPLSELAKVSRRYPSRYPQDPEPSMPVVQSLRERVQETLWRHAGVVRTDSGMGQGIEEIKEVEGEVLGLLSESAWTLPLVELRNLVHLGVLVLEAALARRQSVGCHYNSALPFPDGSSL